MSQQIFSHSFDNGLVLVAEAMPWLESAAFALWVPTGCIYDPPGKSGLSNLLCELIQRGCGSRDSRTFVEDLENLGADCSGAASLMYLSFGGAMPAEALPDVLNIYTDVVRKPHLPEDQLDDARQVCLHEVRSLDDDPPQKMMQQLRLRHYGDPLGRSSIGTEADLTSITIDDIRQHFKKLVQPRGALLSVAGKFEWPKLKETVANLLGEWQGSGATIWKEQPPPRGYLHIPHEGAQTHVGVGYDSIPYSHPDYFQSRAAVGVLSDGMSSRLFEEVREKRGLVYTVYASVHSLKDRGAIFSYAGTTTERAQETLDVLSAELRKLTKGIEPNELKRLKARIKSSLIMQQESSRSRAGSIASDWYYLGRIRPLDELHAILDALSVDSINRYLASNPPGAFTTVTLGAKELEVGRAVS